MDDFFQFVRQSSVGFEKHIPFMLFECGQEFLQEGGIKERFSTRYRDGIVETGRNIQIQN